MIQFDRNSSIVSKERRVEDPDLSPFWVLVTSVSSIDWSKIPNEFIALDRGNCAMRFRITPEPVAISESVGHERSMADGSDELFPPNPIRRRSPRAHVSRVRRVGDRSGRMFVLALRMLSRRGLSCLIVSASNVVPCLTFAGVE